MKFDKLVFVCILGLVSGASFTAAADKATSAPAEKTAIPEADAIRCERLSGVSISEFKATLVENCNLNKPFSSSLSRLLNEDNYFYCCQKRAN